MDKPHKENKMKQKKVIKFHQSIWTLTIPLTMIIMLESKPNGVVGYLVSFIFSLILSLVIIGLVYLSLRVEIVEVVE